MYECHLCKKKKKKRHTINPGVPDPKKKIEKYQQKIKSRNISRGKSDINIYILDYLLLFDQKENDKKPKIKKKLKVTIMPLSLYKCCFFLCHFPCD